MGVAFSWPADTDYENFVKVHGRAMNRLALLLTGNRSDAEDAVQDAVIAVAAKWHSLKPGTSLAYLRTTVSRKAIDIARRRGPVDSVGLAEASDRPVIDLGYLRLESDAEFVRMLATLPPRQRAVLVLRYYADLDDAAVGRMLHCTPQTVRSQASRALARLREEMAPPAGVVGGEK